MLLHDGTVNWDQRSPNKNGDEGGLYLSTDTKLSQLLIFIKWKDSGVNPTKHFSS
jgi:hypothetical protein